MALTANFVKHEITPIYVKEADVPLTKTRKGFIREFLKGRAFTSYKDSAFRTVQCNSGKNRSITEIHQMTLSRFPKTSFDAVLRIIRDLIVEDACVTMTYCTTINKVVLMYTSKATKSYMSTSARSNYYKREGVDGYTLEQYETAINNLK